ncbi:uncharacterized protein LOC124539374 [Vanessa cardui]|uniref:uncharacterized protein LOC124539374 n=1 Tax=Vanessa cardui TaxID=171605 RepID=UPI001F1310D2|nr:uncharacterized protein LOC124539374 [Vanessa cardui]
MCSVFLCCVRQLTLRSTKARQAEEQLQLTLQELKASRTQCDLLLKERDDNEQEFLQILNKNNALKSELSQLHLRYVEMEEQNNNLQEIVSGFDNCRDEYEQALMLTNDLKAKLHKAQQYISELENNNLNLKASQTQCLYDELVGYKATLVSPLTSNKDISTIDLTGDDMGSSSLVLSNNKFKKYIKINRYIKKTQKLIKSRNNCLNYEKICKERNTLKLKMIEYNKHVKDMRQGYEADVTALQAEISYLKSSLDTISKKYELSQNEITGHIAAMNNLLDLSKYNSERFDSLINHYACDCRGASDSGDCSGLCPGMVPPSQSTAHNHDGAQSKNYMETNDIPNAPNDQ